MGCNAPLDRRPEGVYAKQIWMLRVLSSPQRIDGGPVPECGLERVLMLALAAIPLIDLGKVVAWWAEKHSDWCRERAIEGYTLLKPVALLLILGLGSSYLAACKWAALVACILATLVACALASYLIAMLFVYLLGQIFLRNLDRPPASYGRSLVLLLVNYIEFASAFAVLYFGTASLHYSRNDMVVRAWQDILYFSFLTAATVSYGDIVPNGLGRFIAVAQILITFVFVVVVLQTFISRLQDQR